eukprot:1207195-Amorphochlora_amoeboformis.AAC.1
MVSFGGSIRVSTEARYTGWSVLRILTFTPLVMSSYMKRKPRLCFLPVRRIPPLAQIWERNWTALSPSRPPSAACCGRLYDTLENLEKNFLVCVPKVFWTTLLSITASNSPSAGALVRALYRGSPPANFERRTGTVRFFSRRPARFCRRISTAFLASPLHVAAPARRQRASSSGERRQ